MKSILAICFLGLTFALATPAPAQTSAAPTTDKEKLSYALGMDVGGTMKREGFNIDQPTFLNAMRDGMAGAPPKITDDEIRQVLTDFGKQMQAKQQAPTAGGTPPAAPAIDPKKLSLALGTDVGSTIKKQGFDLDQLVFLNAIRDGLTGATPQLTEAQTKQILLDFSKQMRAKQQAGAAAAGSKNRQDGQAFLTANKSKPGVITLPDGLQYKVVTDGTGPLPSASDTVTVKYRGTLIDGTVFDSSDLHGGNGTASFPVGGVIHGWTEALQKMKVGSKWTLYVPADLAYGDKGAGTDIAPGATLIFDVELNAIAGK